MEKIDMIKQLLNGFYLSRKELAEAKKLVTWLNKEIDKRLQFEK